MLQLRIPKRFILLRTRSAAILTEVIVNRQQLAHSMIDYHYVTLKRFFLHTHIMYIYKDF